VTFDWSYYQELARQLWQEVSRAADATDPLRVEASARCAISRSYYAAFCLSRNFIREHDKREPPADSTAHDWVRAYFAHDRDTRRQRIGALLRRMRYWRGCADYDDVFPGNYG